MISVTDAKTIIKFNSALLVTVGENRRQNTASRNSGARGQDGLVKY